MMRFFSSAAKKQNSGRKDVLNFPIDKQSSNQ